MLLEYLFNSGWINIFNNGGNKKNYLRLFGLMLIVCVIWFICEFCNVKVIFILI